MEKDPFAEGADARLAGLDETQNPYVGTEDAVAEAKWNDGWASIDDLAEDEED